MARTFEEFDEAAAADHCRTGRRRREYRDHRLEWMIRSGGLEVAVAAPRDDNIRFSWPG